MKKLFIRLYKESDLPQINKLFFETVHTVNRKDYSPEQINAWAPEDRPISKWQKQFENNIVYVAELNGKIVGFGNMVKSGYLDHLFTHKDYQGQGIASEIFAKLEEAARKLELPEIFTESSITAKPFFL